MKFLDRIILTIVGLLLVAIAAGLVLVTVNVVSVDTIIDFIKNVDFKSTVVLVIMIAGAVIFLFFGLKILFARPKREKISACIIMKTEEGEASVSVTAVENTARLAMATFDDVKESRIAIHPTQAGVNIAAKIAVPTGIVIPELITAVKTYLKSFTEEHTGVPVNHIKIVATEYKQIDPATEKKRMATEKKIEEKKAFEEKKAEEKRLSDEKKAEEKRLNDEKKAEEKRLNDEKKAEKKNSQVQDPQQTHARLFVVADQEEAPKAEDAPEKK